MTTKEKYIFSVQDLTNYAVMKQCLIAFYHSDQPVDYPCNLSHYSDHACDYSNNCPDNHEDFLEDPGIYPANTGDYP